MMRIALLASRRLRHGPMSPLLRFARDFMPFLEQHKIVTTEGCFRAFRRAGLFRAHPSFESVGAGYEGALVRITSRVVTGERDPIDAVVYLVDPRDPSSNFPETNALKRECVVHKKPFLATSRSARLWATLNWNANSPDEEKKTYFIDPAVIPDYAPLCLPLNLQTAALIAHDDKKMEMLNYVAEHFDFVLAFGKRVGTGTTGTLLNGEKPPKYSTEEYSKYESICAVLAEKIISARAADRLQEGQNFVEPLRSGPDGGDVQIAHMVLDRGCQSIIFFEDPAIARQHEQDIQLLERTGRTRGKEVVCVHDPTTAAELAIKWGAFSSTPNAEPLLVSTALERRFKVKSIVVDEDESQWKQILEAASWYLLAQVAALASDRKKQADSVRVTVSWGVGLSELAASLAKRRSKLMTHDRTRRGRVRETSRILKLADDLYLQPGNVRVGPMQGFMAAGDNSVEANAIAREIAEFFGGKSHQLALAALLEVRPDGEPNSQDVPQKIKDHWDRTDILITTCAPVRKEYAGQVRAPGFDYHFRQVEKASCGDVGGIYLQRDGEIFEPDRFHRIGMNASQILKVRERGGQIVLIAGAQAEREEIAHTTLEAGLVSLLITDINFARRLLLRPPLRQMRES